MQIPCYSSRSNSSVNERVVQTYLQLSPFPLCLCNAIHMMNDPGPSLLLCFHAYCLCKLKNERKPGIPGNNTFIFECSVLILASDNLRGQVLYSIAVQSFVATRYLHMQSGQGGYLGHPAWQDPDQVGQNFG